MTKATACAALLGVLVCAAGAGADTIYVAASGGDYTTIQAGIDAAVTGDEVVVASGTYPISDPITYDGKEIMLRSEYNAEDTIIDCQGMTNAFEFNGEGDEATLLDFTIRNGNATYGGAINCINGAELTISGLIIEDCTAVRGGGIYINESPLSVLGTTITGCTASEWGGGIYCYYSTGAQFLGLTIGENTGGTGGGMYIWAGAPHVQLCTFYWNSGGGGGAIHCRDTGMVTIITNILSFSTAGKGISCEGTATPYVYACDIYGNAGGDDACGTALENGSEDPRFCDMDEGNFSLCANSPCLPGGISPSLIGAWGEGCDDCDSPVAQTSWGTVKALYR